MAGLHRRPFVTIISDMFTEHYQGKVSEQELAEAHQELSVLISRLEHSKKNSRKQRAETLRKLKKLPLERLQEILSTEA